jgi:iron complex transport system substrate-binding protein
MEKPGLISRRIISMERTKRMVVPALLVAAAALAACGQGSTDTTQATAAATESSTAAATEASTEASTAASTEAAAEATGETTEEAAGTKEVTTPDGETLEVPESVDAIVSMAPSATRVLIDLGLSDKIVACDTYSEQYYGDQLPADIPTFDMMSPDNEQLIALDPDILFATGMSNAGGNDAYETARENGVCIAQMATPSSLQGIVDDVTFIGEATGTDASSLVQDLTDTESALQTAAAGVTDKKSVLVIASTPTADYPDIYAAGKDTYIDDILTLIGAENVAGDSSGWVSYSEEAAIALNPDVIISSDTYNDAVEAFSSNDAWKDVSALQNDAVFTLTDANELNQPNNHTASAMVEMAKDIYPDAFADVADPYK